MEFFSSLHLCLVQSETKKLEFSSYLLYNKQNKISGYMGSSFGRAWKCGLLDFVTAVGGVQRSKSMIRKRAYMHKGSSNRNVKSTALLVFIANIKKQYRLSIFDPILFHNGVSLLRPPGVRFGKAKMRFRLFTVTFMHYLLCLNVSMTSWALFLK